MYPVQDDAPFEPDRIQTFDVPIAAEGIRAIVGWDGHIQSYFFICVRTSVAHLEGAFDYYLGKPVEVGDLYWAGGRWSKAPLEAEPDMREPIATFSDLVNWTWDEFDWPDAGREVVMRLRDAPAYDQLIHITVVDQRSRTDTMADWMADNVFNWQRQLHRHPD